MAHIEHKYNSKTNTADGNINILKLQREILKSNLSTASKALYSHITTNGNNVDIVFSDDIADKLILDQIVEEHYGNIDILTSDEALDYLNKFILNEDFDGVYYKEMLPLKSLFPTSIIWYTDNTKTKKIVEKTITRSGGGASNIKPNPIIWKKYDLDGSTELVRIQFDIVYDGIFEISKNKTVTKF